jgi:hypothetical protein
MATLRNFAMATAILLMSLAAHLLRFLAIPLKVVAHSRKNAVMTSLPAQVSYTDGAQSQANVCPLMRIAAMKITDSSGAQSDSNAPLTIPAVKIIQMRPSASFQTMTFA